MPNGDVPKASPEQERMTKSCLIPTCFIIAITLVLVFVLWATYRL